MNRACTRYRADGRFCLRPAACLIEFRTTSGGPLHRPRCRRCALGTLLATDPFRREFNAIRQPQRDR